MPTAWTIQTILTRPIYCGYNSFCGNIYKGNYDPIISAEAYNRVQRLLRQQGKIIGRKAKEKGGNHVKIISLELNSPEDSKSICEDIEIMD